MVAVLSLALNWYQKKIGAYDKQSWEKTVDQRILRGAPAVPKKVTRIKTELIDVDLVRGSAFPKAKPQHSWIAATISGVIRVSLLPFYFTWWREQTNVLVSCLLTILYFLQILAIYLFYYGGEDFADVPTSEVLTPAAMMLILGILHSQIVATFSSNSTPKCISRSKRKKMKIKTHVQSTSQNKKSSPENTSDKVECSGHECVVDSCDDQAPIAKELGNSTDSLLYENEKTNSADSTDQLVKRNNSVNTIQEERKTHDSGFFIDISNFHKNSTNKITLLSSSYESDGTSSGEEFFVPKKRTSELRKSYLDKNCEQDGLNKHCPKPGATENYSRYSNSSPNNEKKKRPKKLQKKYSEDSEDIVSHFINSTTKEELRRLFHFKVENKNGECRKRLKSLETPLKTGCTSSCDSEANANSLNTPLKLQTSDLEWPLITNTDCNSDDSSDTTHCSNDEQSDITPSENPFAGEMQESVTTANLNVGCPGSDKGSESGPVSCTIWERNECKKVDLSVLDISSAIIRKVDTSMPSSEYLAVGVLFAAVMSFLPLLFRLQSGATIESIQDVTLDVINFSVPNSNHVIQIFHNMLEVMIGPIYRVKSVVVIVMLERFALGLIYFFLLSVAEKTFKQRLLYAKHFCYLTSSRRARRADLPHFRLNKVRNIKTWLSVRSYLKKIGPQRSVDVIVSIAFILEVCILSFLCVQMLKETGPVYSMKLHCWEALFWTLALGFYLLRFMIIGSKINKKYRNLSVLITEQINLYLHMEQKPHKKEELMLANSVLKLAADLLKELESPFKISGLCANPYLYNFIKVVVLSAFSGVLTEILGFKLKLYKIKIK